ncbi:hypothetical protein NE237_016042 [Protea cynaroides]|uniref:Coenzyme Q-binding protein COQ10 START domain-containing protein n=1 Tax=Protea cynaroides TaxID=273540 RepID=A0A9Q0KF49_9MAGN|nr:hypothetical protein NE237_016042 [Protea cynaroides]
MNAIPLSIVSYRTNSQTQIPVVFLASAFHKCLSPSKTRNLNAFGIRKTLISSPQFLCTLKLKSAPDSSANVNTGSTFLDEPGMSVSSLSTLPRSVLSEDGLDIEIDKLGHNSLRIRSRIAIGASLETIWNILTDYERLADFIPGLAVSQLLEKRENFARILQVGRQNLAFGLKFNAKGVVDCYEKDLENLPFGQRRDIEFKMIEGDFKNFQGKWSIEQVRKQVCTVQTNSGRSEHDSSGEQEFKVETTLSYVVDVEPKLWLPVGLVEGRLCNEIKVNLKCIQKEARKATVIHTDAPAC